MTHLVPQTMLAIRRASGHAVSSHVALPTPGPGELLLEVKVAGICRTDLYAAKGVLPVAEGRVLGHELAGVVVRSGGTLAEGTRVAVVPTLPCGRCPGCADRPERCARARFLGLGADGAFADYLVIPEVCAIPVPNALDDREIAFIEPLAAAMAPLTHLRAEHRVGVLGRGRIASLVSRVITAATGRAPLAFDAESELDDEFDRVVEAAPDDASFARALRALRPGGTLVLKSRPFGRVPFDVSLAVRKELHAVGARYAPFPEAIGWLAESRIEVKDLFGDTFPLTEFERAFELAARADAPKLFLSPRMGRG